MKWEQKTSKNRVKSGKIAIFFHHNFFILFPFHEEYDTCSLMGQPPQINMDHKPYITKKCYYLIKVENMKNRVIPENLNKKKVYFKFGPIYAIFYPISHPP